MEVYITCSDQGPRPVRNKLHPWALPTASIREPRQLCVANELLQFWLLLCAIATRLNLAWLTEHPSRAPQVPLSASIWILPQVEALIAAGAGAVQLLQGHLGAPSAKPTTLMKFRLPALEGSLVRWRDRAASPRHWIKLCGRTESGQFRTMAAKAYPRRMNCAIAEAFVQRLIVLLASAAPRCRGVFGQLAEVYEAICVARRESGHDVGLDFAGTDFLFSS